MIKNVEKAIVINMRKMLNIILPWKVIVLFSILLFSSLSQIYAADITLQWDANTEPDFDHYVIYWGTSSGTYDHSENIAKGTTTYTVTSLDLDQYIYYFAAKAFDTEGLESDYCTEIDTKAPQITSPPTITSMTDETVTIDWHTDEPGNSEVQYKVTTTGGITWGNYGNGVTYPSMVTSHSVTLIGLATETQYYFRVGSTDAGGAGPNIIITDNNPSAEYDFFINQGPDTDSPVITLPPTVTSITDTTAVIEWQTDEPSTSLVQYDDNSSTWGNYLRSKTDTSLVTTHSVTLTGLLADTRYYFRVGSTDGFNNGPTTSNEVNFITETTPDTTAPIITTPPTVTGITKTSAIIEWQTDEPSDSVVEYGVNTSYGSKSTLADYVTQHSVTLSGLSPDTDYDFRVSSTDAHGNGPPLKWNATNPSNNYTFKTNNIDDQAPAITSAPTVTNITESTAVIEWQTDEPSNSQVQYQLNPGGTWGSYSLSENDAGMVTSHSVTLTALDQNRRYYFMVGSADAYGNEPDPTLPNDNHNPSAEQYFTTEGTPDTNAPVISNVTVASTTDETATITWQTDEPSNSMVRYDTRSRWSWRWYSLSENDAGMVTSHSVTLTGLTTGTYYFRVGSTDASGNGPDLNSNATNPSDEYNFDTTVPDDEAPEIDPSSIEAVGITDNTAVIIWQTDEPSNSIVNYGASSQNWGSYDSVESDAEMVTSHSVTLTGLPTGTYYFRVGSTDAFGNGPTWNSNITNPSAEDSFDTTVADTEAPEIYPLTVKAVEIKDTTATIIWDTNEFSNSMVQYGASSTWGNYTWSKNDGKMEASHSVTLTGLTKDTPYHFRVGSTDAYGNGPDPTPPNNNNNPSQNECNFTTTNNDNDPPSIIGYHIDYANDAIDITYDEANMQNANIEANYSFSPNLYFRTAGGSDDITYQGSNIYRLFMSFIPENTGFTLTVTGITDQAGNEVDPASITLGIPSTAGAIKEVIPYNKAGIDDSTRVPNNTSFAVRIEDSDGIDTTDLTSIIFTINDGFLTTIYDYNLDNTDVVRVIPLDPNQTKDNLTKLWVVYDRSKDYTYGPIFEFGRTVTISVDVKDKNENTMNGTYSFKVETEAQHNNAIANLPLNTPTPDSPSLGLTTISVDSGDLVGAQIIFNSNEPVPPTFGPLLVLGIDEPPSLNLSNVQAVGSSALNLQPPTVFDTPVTIFIPCPGHPYASTLNIYRYTGTSWVLACDVFGNVQSGGEAWMVPGTRVNHDNGSPSTIEIQVYHFTGVQAGFSSVSAGRSTGEVAGVGCFIATAAYGSNMDRHVKILTEFKDKRLVTNSIGRGIVDAYYTLSPPVASYLHKHPLARAIVRYALVPITGIAYISLFIHPLVLSFTFIFMLLTGVYCVRRLPRSRGYLAQ